ncbi:hypothetical protein CSOJ01_10256 [Colletotrichum sojae]|uniref:Uncharacterized protein n=1 Tax=Colletotrichum sojae TaxID=2175907 RepID=A0A8H6J1C8_9PEZI|nr:hypothetical protein CSOJ01_10256 [Colletotrichum sojae]
MQESEFCNLLTRPGWVVVPPPRILVLVSPLQRIHESLRSPALAHFPTGLAFPKFLPDPRVVSPPQTPAIRSSRERIPSHVEPGPMAARGQETILRTKTRLSPLSILARRLARQGQERKARTSSTERETSSSVGPRPSFVVDNRHEVEPIAVEDYRILLAGAPFTSRDSRQEGERLSRCSHTDTHDGGNPFPLSLKTLQSDDNSMGSSSIGPVIGPLLKTVCGGGFAVLAYRPLSVRRPHAPPLPRPRPRCSACTVHDDIPVEFPGPLQRLQV